MKISLFAEPPIKRENRGNVRMLKELTCILCCFALVGIYGNGVYKGIKNKDKSDIIYHSIMAGIFAIITIIQILDTFIY